MCLFPSRSFAAGTFPLSTYVLYYGKSIEWHNDATISFMYIIQNVMVYIAFGSNINGLVSFICNRNKCWKTRLRADSHFYSNVCFRYIDYTHTETSHTIRLQIVFMHVVSIHQIQNIQNTSADSPEFNAIEAKRARFALWYILLLLIVSNDMSFCT